MGTYNSISRAFAAMRISIRAEYSLGLTTLEDAHNRCRRYAPYWMGDVEIIHFLKDA